MPWIETAFGTALLLGPLAWTVAFGGPAEPTAAERLCPVRTPEVIVRTVEVPGTAEAVADEVPVEPETAEPAVEVRSAPGATPLIVFDGALVLPHGPGGDEVTSLDVRFDVEDGSIVVGGRLDAPGEAIDGWLGSRVALYGPHGRVCTVELTGARAYASVYGDVEWLFDDESERSLLERAWERRGQDRPDATLEGVLGRLAAERLVRQGEVSTLADWRVVDGDCRGALWGAPATVEVEVWRSGADVDDGLVESLRGTDAVAGARVAFDEQRADLDDAMTWVQHEAETLRMERWAGPEGATLITGTLGVAEVCGGLDTLVELLSFDEGETWLDGYRPFEAVFSIDGVRFGVVDGSDVSAEAITIVTIGGEPTTSFVAHEFYGCPC